MKGELTMSIKWSNVVVFGLLILAVVLTVYHHRAVHAAITSIGKFGPGYTREESVLGLCVLGIILVSLVAVVRLVVSDNRRDEP